MPLRDPADYKDEDSWMSYCVPEMERNHPRDQALAACLDTWRGRNKAAKPESTFASRISGNTGAVLVNQDDGLDPADYDNEDDFMEACMAEHDDEEMCSMMWSDRNKALGRKEVKTMQAWSLLQIKAVQTEQRIIEGFASTPTVDRVGDIMDPMGGLFKLPMPLLWQHRHDEPVGQVIEAKPTREGIKIKARFAFIEEAGELKNLVDRAWQAVKAGLVRGLSIGFMGLDSAPLSTAPLGTVQIAPQGVKWNRWNWLELSLVTIPANADATISVIKSYDLGSNGLLTPFVKTIRNIKSATGKVHSVKLS